MSTVKKYIRIRKNGNIVTGLTTKNDTSSNIKEVATLMLKKALISTKSSTEFNNRIREILFDRSETSATSFRFIIYRALAVFEPRIAVEFQDLMIYLSQDKLRYLMSVKFRIKGIPSQFIELMDLTKFFL